jgi:hypothetical protein
VLLLLLLLLSLLLLPLLIATTYNIVTLPPCMHAAAASQLLRGQHIRHATRRRRCTRKVPKIIRVRWGRGGVGGDARRVGRERVE